MGRPELAVTVWVMKEPVSENLNLFFSPPWNEILSSHLSSHRGEIPTPVFLTGRRRRGGVAGGGWLLWASAH